MVASPMSAVAAENNNTPIDLTVDGGQNSNLLIWQIDETVIEDEFDQFILIKNGEEVEYESTEAFGPTSYIDADIDLNKLLV